MRILGLDIGMKRIGIAISDELCLTAQRVQTLERTGLKKDISKILHIVKQQDVEKIVTGMPLGLRGELGAMASEVRKFINALRKSTGLPVEEWDERFSTSAVERAMIEAGMNRRKRKNIVDEVSAVYILQGYLDHKALLVR